jgi:hypothetical protein
MHPFTDEYAIKSALTTTSVYHCAKSSDMEVIASTSFFSCAIFFSLSFIYNFRTPRIFSLKKFYKPVYFITKAKTSPPLKGGLNIAVNEVHSKFNLPLIY